MILAFLGPDLNSLFVRWFLAMLGLTMVGFVVFLVAASLWDAWKRNQAWWRL